MSGAPTMHHLHLVHGLCAGESHRRSRRLLGRPALLAPLLLLGACGPGPAPVAPAVSAVTAPPPPLECARGTADCDGDRATLCEAEIDFNGESCGACGARCGDGERCVFGTCRRTGQLAVGLDHSCALAGDGGVRCWGVATGGALGDGSDSTSVMRTGAVRAAGLSGAVSVAAGGSWVSGATSCALLRDGHLSCWGYFMSTRPAVQRRWEGVVDMAVTEARLCAVLRDGSVTCRDLTDKESDAGPTLEVIGGLHDAVQICASPGYSYDPALARACALRRNGHVVCWGADKAAAWWADPEELDRSTVLGTVPGVKDAVQISCGAAHDCALLRNGRVHCWGTDSFGQLGDERAAPLHDLVEVAAGEDHTCALRKDRTVWCWGRSFDGRLGNGSDEPVEGAVQVLGLEDAVHIGTGEGFSCAMRAAGGTACWGRRDALGDGHSTGPRPLPGLQGAASVRVGSGLVCALDAKGGVECLLDASGSPLQKGPRKGPSARDVAAIPMGDGADESFCFVQKKGKVECYGSPTLSDAHFSLSGIGPLRSLLLGGIGRTTGFALLASGGVSTLTLPVRSFDLKGELRVQATPVQGISGARKLAGKWHSACALLASGEVKCAHAKAGAGGKAEVTGVHVVPVKDAIGLSGYDSRYSILHKDGTVSSFRMSRDAPPSAPEKVAGVQGVVEISVGHLFACARLGSGDVMCWGDNFSGELGTGDLVQWEGPVRVAGLNDAIAVDAAARSACAVRKDGSVLCWGAGVTEPSAIFYPVPVADDPGPPAPPPPSAPP